MGNRGGKREGAGRKKGVANKVTTALKARIALDTKQTPLEFLLETMRAPMPMQDPKEELAVYLFRLRAWNADRMEAAKAAVPYTSPRLESIEHKGDPNNPLETRTSLTVEFVEPA